jgi:radical SAM protein with 4Fe4S-binding SPASM domain
MTENFHIQWHITDRCNLRCGHCYQDTFDKESELDWSGLKKICDNLIDAMRRRKNKLTISLTGGEPFLKDELWRLIPYLSASDQVLELNIITNATLIQGYIDKLKKHPKLKTIFVSLEATSPKVNDAIRGEGNFQKVNENLNLLKENGFKVYIMFTLQRRNIDQACKLLDFCKRRSLEGFVLERFIPLGQSIKIRDELVSASQLEGVYKIIFNQCGVDFFSQSVKYHALKVEAAKEARLYGAECVVGKFGCAILASGQVLPCRRFVLPLGDLLTQSFDDIWCNSRVLKLASRREDLKGACRDCNLDDCLGCRALSHALYGDFLLSDPLCWLKPAKKS